MPDRDTPFPFSRARDLLGVARAAWLASMPGSAQRRQLERAGQQLAEAILLARQSELGSSDYGKAWHLAEIATRAIGATPVWTPRTTIIEAACESVVEPSEAVLRRRAKARW